MIKDAGFKRETWIDRTDGTQLRAQNYIQSDVYSLTWSEETLLQNTTISCNNYWKAFESLRKLIQTF